VGAQQQEVRIDPVEQGFHVPRRGRVEAASAKGHPPRLKLESARDKTAVKTADLDAEDRRRERVQRVECPFEPPELPRFPAERRAREDCDLARSRVELGGRSRLKWPLHDEHYPETERRQHAKEVTPALAITLDRQRDHEGTHVSRPHRRGQPLE
jgi:hypothetical protein